MKYIFKPCGRLHLLSKMASALLLTLAVSVAFHSFSVYAQPSPQVQKKISAAIKAAANSTSIDYTAFVNPFVGTGKKYYEPVRYLSH